MPNGALTAIRLGHRIGNFAPEGVIIAAHATDLHSHSTCSDGALHPAALVEAAARRGVKRLALTDHDTTAGYEEARLAGALQGVEVVCGIELSAWHGKGLHILGYFLDPADEDLQALVQRQAENRLDRARAIGRKLATLRCPIDIEAVIEGTGGNVGRPHIAKALVKAGHVPDTKAAFDRLIADDGPAYVPASRLSVAFAIRSIHAAGGVAVLAHPGVENMDHVLPELAEAGLDGLEVDHPSHSAAQRAHYRGLAARLDLVPTGGSDFHTPRGHIKLGCCGTEGTALEALLALRDAHRQARIL